MWTLSQWRSHREPRPRYSALEIGTGWKHFFGIFLRLFEDLDLTLFDVWDNRQFSAVPSSLESLRRYLATEPSLSTEEKARAFEIIASARELHNFDEIYELIGATYVLNPNGDLRDFKSNLHDLVFSVDVLEHVHADQIKESIRDYFRILKSGGLSIHQIGIDDHLAHYDPSASAKQYLAYDEREWNLRFESKIQYFNRLSAEAFVQMFRSAGFQEVEVIRQRDVDALKSITIAPQYRQESREDLETTRLFLVHRKP
jgi:hypothetical protein